MCRGRGGNILLGTVAKAKVSDLEDEIRELFSSRTRKVLTVVVEAIFGNRSFLVRFWYGCDKGKKKLNQPTIRTVDKIPMTEESEVPTISTKYEEAVGLEKGYYHGVYVLLNFND